MADPESLAVADFNGDGKPDLAVGTAQYGRVSVLLNTTSPNASQASFTPHEEFAFSHGMRALGLADINGDGEADLIVSDYNTNVIGVRMNTTPVRSNTPSFGVRWTLGADTAAMAWW